MRSTTRLTLLDEADGLLSFNRYPRAYALGVESLERFIRGEPLYRVHECVFGVLALESEPVDPRL